MLQSDNVKTAFEIGKLVSGLTPTNQAFVLNTINALIFSQENKKDSSIKDKVNKSA